MPAGVSWPRYIRLFGASMLAMFAGAQVVHQYYLPDLVRDNMKTTYLGSLSGVVLDGAPGGRFVFGE
uniref:Uncharacterized protein n=1 Tax=Nothobranchius furzeri TaxID=105023 RepID=A0A8C6LPW8_NOTFU